MKIIKLLGMLMIISLMTVSCGDEEPVEAGPTNAEQIQKYITDNSLDAIEVDDTGMFYVVSKEGDGEFPTLQSNVTVHYHGTLVDGTVFDSSLNGDPLTFPLTGVIEGWQLGIPKFSRGGAGKLLIPNTLAYGGQSRGAIPAFSVLIFDVELLDF